MDIPDLICLFNTNLLLCSLFLLLCQVHLLSFQEYPTVILLLFLVLTLSKEGTFIRRGRKHGLVIAALADLLRWNFLSKIPRGIWQHEVDSLRQLTVVMQTRFYGAFNGPLQRKGAKGKKGGIGCRFPKFHAIVQ